MERILGVVNVAVCTVRTEPSDRSEISTQLLFGDRLEVLEQRDKWWRIVTKYDNYEGWADPRQFTLVNEAAYDAFSDTGLVAGLNVGQYVTMQATGEKIYLSPGASLPAPAGDPFTIGKKEYIYFGDIVVPDLSTFSNIEETARFFLHVPYLWGGKTMFGIDCSGFMQTIYKFHHLHLRRDAWQQAEQGQTVDFLAAAQTGDLAFFDNEEGRVTHVGMMLGNTRIIHSSGRVRVDHIDNQGIYSEEQNKHTHKLRIVKRLI